jgi:hypothetical protein
MCFFEKSGEINSTNVYIFIFFQEQGHRNDLILKVAALSLKMIAT